jgi:hypothetical protein
MHDNPFFATLFCNCISTICVLDAANLSNFRSAHHFSVWFRFRRRQHLNDAREWEQQQTSERHSAATRVDKTNRYKKTPRV